MAPAATRKRPPTCSARSGDLDSPRTENGGIAGALADAGRAVVRQLPDQGPGGQAVADAEIDVWHSSTEGLYENQDPSQADMNLRGKLTSDSEGRFWFRTIKPAGYPIPINGPVGALLRAQGRHNMRPAHLHFLIYKEGYKTHISQVYSPDDPFIDTDVQFGVTKALIGPYKKHGAGEKAPADDVTGRLVVARLHVQRR